MGGYSDGRSDVDGNIEGYPMRYTLVGTEGGSSNSVSGGNVENKI